MDYTAFYTPAMSFLGSTVISRYHRFMDIIRFTFRQIGIAGYCNWSLVTENRSQRLNNLPQIRLKHVCSSTYSRSDYSLHSPKKKEVKTTPEHNSDTARFSLVRNMLLLLRWLLRERLLLARVLLLPTSVCLRGWLWPPLHMRRRSSVWCDIRPVAWSC